MNGDHTTNARRIARRIVGGPPCDECGATDCIDPDGQRRCKTSPDRMPPARRIIPNPRGRPEIDYWPGYNPSDVK